MARNLVAAGFEVTGFNRGRGPVDTLVAAGGRGATSVAEAVAQADVVLTMLPDTPDVEGVIAGPDGVLAHARTGALVIDMSTVSAALAVELGQTAAEVGIAFLDAPVSGGEAGAVEGTLAIMVGGEAPAFEMARALFDVLGRTVVHVGAWGSGQLVKAANQLIVAGNIALLAEALTFLRAHELDPIPALQVIGAGLAGSAVLDRKARAMLSQDFTPGFRLALHDKDLRIALAAAADRGLTLPVTPGVAHLVASACSAGLGDRDHAALVKVVEGSSRSAE
ncbi:MAG: NAD(P)-binding domain-containing protein [Nocardioides sp.]